MFVPNGFDATEVSGYALDASDATLPIPAAVRAGNSAGFCPRAAMTAVFGVGGAAAETVAPVSVKAMLASAVPLSVGASAADATVPASDHAPTTPAVTGRRYTL